MPRYVYACDHCDQEFQIHHGMSESLEVCEICGEKDTIHRIPQMTFISKPPSEEGKRITEAIEENREVFKEMHKDARNQTYDN